MSLADVERDYEVYVETQQAQQQELFTVNDDSAADWCLRRIAQLEADMVKRALFVDAEMERLASFQKQLDEADQKSLDLFRELLKSYFDTLQAAGKLGKKKSYPLPHGIIGTRKAAPKFNRDDKALLDWAKANRPDVVYEKPTLVWTDQKDPAVDGGVRKGLKGSIMVTDAMQAVDSVTGCMIEGLTVVEPERDEFYASASALGGE